MSTVRDGDINLEELRSQLLRHSAVLLICVGALLMWLDLRRERFPTVIFFVWGGFLLLGVGARRLSVKHPALGRYLLVWGGMAGLSAAMILTDFPWLVFLVLPLVLISALLIPHSHMVVAVVIGAITIWHSPPSSSSVYALEDILLMLVVGVFLASMIVNKLYTALQWAWTMHERANELLELARDRQEVLNRTLKSLELAIALQRRNQRELYFARKEANAARRMKEQFAANISHELRTPLNLILGFSEIMYLSPEVYGEIDWTPPLRRDIYHIYRSSRHLLEMVDDILDLSQLDFVEFSLHKEPTLLAELVRSTVEIVGDLFRRKPVALQVDVPADLPILEIDRTRIRQVLLNLLNNAQRFTEKGHVRLEIQLTNREVIFCVSDTGSGIPADKLPSIFEEFYQVDRSLRRSHDGVGLGLAICKRFVEAHEGRIWIKSQEGVGMSFFFTLPLTDAIVARRFQTGEVEMTWPENPASLLVVDPDPDVAAIIARHVEGYEVIQVGNPEGLAAEIALHHPKAVIYNVPPDKPVDVNRSLPVHVPLIECSLPSRTWMAGDFKVVTCLTKPVSIRELLAETERLGEILDVLIVDDDRGFCQLIERALQASGKPFAVRLAYDGKDGLRAIHERKPDLVLLDLIMPVLDGFAVLKEIQQDIDLVRIPVILLTATSFAEDALARHNGRMVIQRTGGLRPVEVLRCLQKLVGVLEADYGGQVLPDELENGAGG